MSKKSKTPNLDILRSFGKLAEELRNTPTPMSYWIEEEKWMQKRMKKNREFNKSIEMSYEKFHQPYTI